jgi:hypothetical protein
MDMPGREKFGPISELDFDSLLQALSSTTKGRLFLEEYRRRCQPAETLGLLNSLARIEASISAAKGQLQPERIAQELRHIAMTLEISLDGAGANSNGDTTARRFALADRARRELVTLARSLAGEVDPLAESQTRDPAEDR